MKKIILVFTYNIHQTKNDHSDGHYNIIIYNIFI